MELKWEKIYWYKGSNRKTNLNFVSGDKFDFYETFGMTKYDATDRITIVLKYFGENIEIELEKIK